MDFEKVIINYLQHYFPVEIQKKYPLRIQVDDNGFIENQKDFEDLVKTELTD